MKIPKIVVVGPATLFALASLITTAYILGHDPKTAGLLSVSFQKPSKFSTSDIVPSVESIAAAGFGAISSEVGSLASSAKSSLATALPLPKSATIGIGGYCVNSTKGDRQECSDQPDTDHKFLSTIEAAPGHLITGLTFPLKAILVVGTMAAAMAMAFVLNLVWTSMLWLNIPFLVFALTNLGCSIGAQKYLSMAIDKLEGLDFIVVPGEYQQLLVQWTAFATLYLITLGVFAALRSPCIPLEI